MNDMLISDWLLRSFVLLDCGGVDVALVRYYLECFLSSGECSFLSARIRFLFVFSLSVVLSFENAAVVKVFDWLVIIWEINKFVH